MKGIGDRLAMRMPAPAREKSLKNFGQVSDSLVQRSLTFVFRNTYAGGNKHVQSVAWITVYVEDPQTARKMAEPC
jgi:hypothetical protein